MLEEAPVARYPKYDANPIWDMMRACDGLIFLDRMTAATGQG